MRWTFWCSCTKYASDSVAALGQSSPWEGRSSIAITICGGPRKTISFTWTVAAFPTPWLWHARVRRSSSWLTLAKPRPLKMASTAGKRLSLEEALVALVRPIRNAPLAGDLRNAGFAPTFSPSQLRAGLLVDCQTAADREATCYQSLSGRRETTLFGGHRSPVFRSEI